MNVEYRVAREGSVEEDYAYQLIEVFYDDTGIFLWDAPISVVSTSLGSINSEIDLIEQAKLKPVLDLNKLREEFSAGTMAIPFEDVTMNL